MMYDMGFQAPPKKSSRKKTWLLNNKQKSPLLTPRLHDDDLFVV